jgi:hypothetical protein
MDSVEPLLARTYRLLDASGLSYRAIAAGSGQDVNWVAKFVQRAIGEPGVSKVQAVHDFLVSRGPATTVPVRKRRMRAA